jgi:hypothetical protein
MLNRRTFPPGCYAARGHICKLYIHYSKKCTVYTVRYTTYYDLYMRILKKCRFGVVVGAEQIVRESLELQTPPRPPTVIPFRILTYFIHRRLLNDPGVQKFKNNKTPSLSPTLNCVSQVTMHTQGLRHLTVCSKLPCIPRDSDI